MTRVFLTYKKKSRIWELDFLRGVSIILMCFDHFFFDVYYLFYHWRTGGKFFSSLYRAAEFFFGYADDSILIPLDKMQYAEFVFLGFILFSVTVAFLVKLIKEKGKPSYSALKGFTLAFTSISVCILAISFIQRFIGYKVVEGNSLREFIHTVILWIFFILCGEGCYFSRSNVKRTLQISLCACAISLVTILGERLFDMEGIAVRYGVLHMLAMSVCIFTLIQLACTALFKDPVKRKYAISLTCFAVGVTVYAINQYLWTVDVVPNDALAWFHYKFGKNFHSADWFTLSENLHRVLFGAAIAPFVYPDRKSYVPKLSPLNKGVVCFLGRKTIWIVLLHQVIIYVLLACLDTLY